jgi:tetratricopeptide (TPR) repeat protein
MLRSMLVLVALLVVAWTPIAAPASQAATPELLALLRSRPADSLVSPLRRLELSRTRPADAAEAAMTLGRLHYARGEFREAATAFGRAAARLDPARKSEARYWTGLAWLGLGEPMQARAALEDVASGDSPRRREALLGLAQAWELAERPERAFDVLTGLVDEPLEEFGAATLERYAVLAERLGRSETARAARERLLRDYPRSIEAAAARLAQARAGDPGVGAVAVVIGSFLDQARARSLANEARRAGFPGAQVITRGEKLAAVHLVRLGVYGTRGEAQRAGEQAERALGVTWQITRLP